MAIYKCVKSYKSYNDKNYYYGNTISDSVYNSLPYREWSNFQKQYQEEIDDTPSPTSSLIDDGIAFASSLLGSDTSSSDTSFDSCFDSSSSDTSFYFGGGDGGGAGSSGDW